MNNKIDITPSTNIYRTFANFKYNHSDAIAEFIDNSTQSFKNNKNNNNNFIPKIVICYDLKENSLQIMDNCCGIHKENIEKILKINMPNREKGSRNEFGMGLKTSAFWFGEKLQIISKNKSDDGFLKIKLDLNELENYSDNLIPYEYVNENLFENCWLNEYGLPFDSGTIINISKLKNKITKNSLIKVANNFSSKYRNDFNEDNLELRVILKDDNDLYDANVMLKNEPTKIESKNIWDAGKLEYKYIKLKIDEQTNKEIKIEINDILKFENIKYKIEGWVGIAEKGSRDHPGLTLFRNGRTIKGDDKYNQYKPEKIFKDSGSFEYQRIVGWLNLDDFPVTQQKNDFAWHNGLEDEFIDFIYEKIKNNNEIDFFKIVKTAKIKSEIPDYNKIYNKKFVGDFENSFNNNSNNIKIKTELVEKDIDKIIRVFLKDDTYLVSSIEKDIIFDVKLVNNSKEWLEIIKNKENTYRLNLNIELDFFTPFNSQIDIIRDQLISFAVHFAYSEIVHMENGSCDSPNHMRNIINKTLNAEIITKDKENGMD